MRLVLERSELLEILGKHLKILINEEAVIVRADPFEVELSGLPLVEEHTPVSPRNLAMSDPPARVAKPPSPEEEPDTSLIEQRADKYATSEPPPPGADGIEVSESKGSGLHPMAVLEESRRIEQELDRANPTLAAQQRKLAARKPPDDEAT